MYLFKGLHFESLRHEVSQRCFERGDEKQRERKEKRRQKFADNEISLYGNLDRQSIDTMVLVFYRTCWSLLMSGYQGEYSS